MRTGLVLIAVCLLAIGVALAFLGTVNFPYDSTAQSTEPFSFTLPGSQELDFSIEGQNGSTSMVVDFSSSAPVEVWLTSCNPHQALPPPCIVGHVAPSDSGTISISQPQMPYYLVVNSKSSASADVSVVVRSSSSSTHGLELWEDIVVLAGAGILLLGGVILALLGLFLQGNPYAEDEIPSKTDLAPETPNEHPEEKKGPANREEDAEGAGEPAKARSDESEN
jgi:hypothetical protein